MLEGGQVRVQYREWSGQGIGRFHIKALDKDDEEVDMVTQANIWNWAKAAVCPRYYKDCDISNCHPVLLVQMCKQYGIPCETLERFNEERDALIAETGLDKRQFKQLFFSGVMYHPTCDDDQLARKLKRFGIDSEPQLFTALRYSMNAGCEIENIRPVAQTRMLAACVSPPRFTILLLFAVLTPDGRSDVNART